MRRTSAACLVLLAVAAGGCGASSKGGGGDKGSVKPGPPLPITAREYSFNPKDVTVDTGGKPVTFNIQLNNGGSNTPHPRLAGARKENGGPERIPGGPT